MLVYKKIFVFFEMPKVGRRCCLCISHIYTPGKHLMPPDGAVTHFQVEGGGMQASYKRQEEEEEKGGLSSAAAVWTWNTLGQQRRALYRFFFSFLFLIGASLLPHI